MLQDSFANRLHTIMAIRGIKAVDLSKKTNIAKSQISHWLGGQYKAKQDSLTVLAEFFNVSEAWLMGFDVPMDRDDSAFGIDEVDKLYNENSHLLTKDDKATIKFIIENRINGK